MDDGPIKDPDEVLCEGCGRTVPGGFLRCPHCDAGFRETIPVETKRYGSSTDGIPAAGGHYYAGAEDEPRLPVKSKAVAVVLAVFFGHWAWLYTYGRNRLKFWWSFGIFGVIYIINISYSCSFIQGALSGAPYPDNYFTGGFLVFSILVSFIYFGIWVWVLIDNISKPDSFFRHYPHG